MITYNVSLLDAVENTSRQSIARCQCRLSIKSLIGSPATQPTGLSDRRSLIARYHDVQVSAERHHLIELIDTRPIDIAGVGWRGGFGGW